MALFNKFFMAGIITIVMPFTTFTVSTGNPAAAVSAPVSTATTPSAVETPAGGNLSYNWAGYEVTQGTFTAISGTWTVPNVTASASGGTQADATWVGIGGISGHDLIQAGTQAIIDNSGVPTYEAWYETLPQSTQQVALTVSPGDSITASLTQTSPGEWAISLRDNTTGASYSSSIAYDSSLSSAEWIEEMPSDGSGLVPLDNFGSVSFAGGTTTENGSSMTIAQSGASAITMVNRANATLASVSALGSDGESFTVSRTSASPVASGAGYFTVPTSGRGWRRVGVDVQGWTPRTFVSTSTGTGESGSTGSVTRTGNAFPENPAWSQLLQLLSQMRQLRQLQNSYFRR